MGQVDSNKSFDFIVEEIDADTFQKHKSAFFRDPLDYMAFFASFSTGKIRCELTPGADPQAVMCSIYVLDAEPKYSQTDSGRPYTWYDADLSICIYHDESYDAFTERVKKELNKVINAEEWLVKAASGPLASWD